MHTLTLPKHSVNQLISFCAAGGIIGLIYVLLGHNITSLRTPIGGAVLGILIGITLGLCEIYLLRPYAAEKSFFLLLSTRLLLYLGSIAAILLIAAIVGEVVSRRESVWEVFTGDELETYVRGAFLVDFLFTFTIALIANFTRLISFKVGRGNLANFILGVYHRPRIVNRAFLFLEITNAHKVLQERGVEGYHEFLNNAFNHISMIVMNHNGYVYEYVDNQMTVYWNSNNSRWSEALVTCYQEIYGSLSQADSLENSSSYVLPEIKAAAHCGEVVQAEIGELKTEIVFHGDVLNTVARMLHLGVDQDIPCVISEPVVKQINRNGFAHSSPIGEIELQGKHLPISLFSLQ